MRPAFLDAMSWAMAEVYGSVTDQILINLAKYFPYIKDSLEALDLFQYQARMLAQLGQVTRETADITAKISRTQSILNVAAGETVTGVSSWNEAVGSAVKKMVDNGLTGFVDHAGRQWSPEAYVAMDVRSTMFNVARDAVAERAQEYGADLYQVSSHNGARPLCYPWQGQVIARAGPHGSTTDLDGNPVEVYAQSETSYGQAAGLFGRRFMPN